MDKLYQDIVQGKKDKAKKIAILIDPDNLELSTIQETVRIASRNSVDYFFIGGSLIVNDVMDLVIDSIKAICDIPVVIFPGQPNQINNKADGILFLSLISGRNPDLLIGNHVIAAPMLRSSDLEILPTGYMLIDGGKSTAVQYISNTNPIPNDQTGIALCTALAGQYLGLKLIYLDAGSGANQPVPSKIIRAISSELSIPVIVGGGIRNANKVSENFEAGADIIVIGNAVEKDPNFIVEIAKIKNEFNQKINPLV